MMADDSDNDYRDINYLRKIKRAERLEAFQDGLLIDLKNKYKVVEKENSYEIITERHGVLVYFPKADSILFSNRSSWVKGYGLRWIKKHLLAE